MNRKRSRTEWIQQNFVYTPEPMAELPEPDRPTNRILRDGPAVCNIAELLQALIGGPKAESVARALLGRYPNVSAIAQAPVAELTALACGLGEKGAIKLKVALELGRRALTYSPDPRPQIKTPADAAQLLTPEMGALDQEEVRTLLLDTRNRLLGVPLIYRGNLNSASMRIGEVFKPAIRYNAAVMIVCHNHPSGDTAPSAEDVRVTKTLVQSGKLLDIELLDHLIIGHTGHFTSLKERGLGFDD
jgi:DNA repair protein RadC